MANPKKIPLLGDTLYSSALPLPRLIAAAAAAAAATAAAEEGMASSSSGAEGEEGGDRKLTSTSESSSTLITASKSPSSSQNEFSLFEKKKHLQISEVPILLCYRVALKFQQRLPHFSYKQGPTNFSPPSLYESRPLQLED